MTEADHQSQLEHRARERGWRAWRTPRSDQAEPGEADLRLLWRCELGPCPGPHSYLVVELKVRGHHRTDAQRQAATDYAAAGVPCYEWRLPEDLAQAEALLGLTPAVAVSPIGDVRQPEPEAMPDLSDLPPAMQARARQALAEEAARRREHRAKVEAKQQ